MAIGLTLSLKQDNKMNDEQLNKMWGEMCELQKENERVRQEYSQYVNNHPLNKICNYFCDIADKALYKFFGAILFVLEKIIRRKL